jgi:hypothetical protein
MKRIVFNILFLVGCILLVTACSDSEYNNDNLFPEKYHKVLLFKNSGALSLDLSTVQTDYQDSMVVLKAGSDPSLQADVKFNIVDQTAIDSAYNSKQGLDYRVIPSDCYAFNDGQEMTFDSGETGKYLVMTIHADKIYNYMLAAPNISSKTKFVLPILMVSDKDTVNADKNGVMTFIDVHMPTITLPGNKYDASIVYQTLDYNLTATVTHFNLDRDFTCEFWDESKKDSLVQVFKDGHPSYVCETLPTEAYGKLPTLQFTKGSATGTAVLSLKRAPLKNDVHYVLPLMLKSTTLPNTDLNPHVQYIIVTAPTYGTEWVTADETATWKPVFDNCDQKSWSEQSGGDNGGPYAIIDNVLNTYWHSCWGTGLYTGYGGTNGAGHSTGGVAPDDYNYNFTDYHTCVAKRAPGDICLVFDMQKPYYVVGVNTYGRPLNTDTKTINFYVSPDSEFKFLPIKKGGKIDDYNNPSLNNWTFVLQQVRTATASTWQQAYLDPSNTANVVKGRFIKLRFMDSARASVVNLSELRILKLVSINGNPIE